MCVDYKVWFTSDTHFSHPNILKYTRRDSVFGLDKENPDMDFHNECVINIWNSKVGKKDHIYVLGDLSFGSPEETRRIIERLHGVKYFIIGNHDGGISANSTYFKSMSSIKTVKFKISSFPFLEEDVIVNMCHYPMICWEKKHLGSIMLHGHTHGNIDHINEASPELRLDVGIDGKAADYSILGLDDVYGIMKKKSGGMLFKEYCTEKNNGGFMIL